MTAPDELPAPPARILCAACDRQQPILNLKIVRGSIVCPCGSTRWVDVDGGRHDYTLTPNDHRLLQAAGIEKKPSRA
jgi:uncharacterized lipoprotein